MNNPHEDGPPEATDRRGCTAEEAASSLMADHICPECQLIIYDPPRGAMNDRGDLICEDCCCIMLEYKPRRRVVLLDDSFGMDVSAGLRKLTAEGRL